MVCIGEKEIIQMAEEIADGIMEDCSPTLSMSPLHWRQKRPKDHIFNDHRHHGKELSHCPLL
jgi:hypothetical protein